MGEFRFRVPVDWKLDPYHANSIHVVGMDGIPWPCRISTADDPENPKSRKIISVTRNREESGRLYVVFDFAQWGEQLVCTGTLPVRDEPYELFSELARGTLNRLRNQISIWEEGGLLIPPEVLEKLEASTALLAESILSDSPDQRDSIARVSIETAMQSVSELARAFGQQISQFRREHDELANFWLANQVGREQQFLPSVHHEAFDLVATRVYPDDAHRQPSRTEIESLPKRVIVGPWLDASVDGMSDHLVKLDDFLARKDQLLIECRQMLDQMPRTASLLHLVCGLNGMGHRHLSYPQQVQITADLLRMVEESEVEIPTMVSFDFPWAERLAGAVGGIHPLQIADSLLRQGMNISFLGLDINLDYWPNGSVIRDPLQWIDLVDIWAQLGLPLVICLRCPFGEQPERVMADAAGSHNQTRSNVSDEQRRYFLQTVLPMLVARPTVHGLIMRQWMDRDDARFPNAGLVDENGKEKETFAVLKSVRDAID